MPDTAAALEIIEQALAKCHHPYIAFSGGKDSLVVEHLVHSVKPDVEMIYCDDELLYPEHVDYIRQVKDREGDRLRLVSGGGLHRQWFYPWNDNFRLVANAGAGNGVATHGGPASRRSRLPGPAPGL